MVCSGAAPCRRPVTTAHWRSCSLDPAAGGLQTIDARSCITLFNVFNFVCAGPPCMTRATRLDADSASPPTITHPGWPLAATRRPTSVAFLQPGSGAPAWPLCTNAFLLPPQRAADTAWLPGAPPPGVRAACESVLGRLARPEPPFPSFSASSAACSRPGRGAPVHRQAARAIVRAPAHASPLPPKRLTLVTKSRCTGFCSF